MQHGERPQVLVLGPDERGAGLASRLSLLGCCRGVRAEDLPGALRAKAGVPRAFPVGFLATDHGLADVAGALREIGDGAVRPMRWIAFGPRPDAAGKAALARAGVRFALFDPASDEELRFVVNQALHPERTTVLRAEERVPADLPARIVTRNGEKVALIYNLSSTGAYVATPRPTLRGGAVTLLFSLPGGEVELAARVVWNNVPGNLRRYNAPIGMGLRFTEIPGDVQTDLLRWVDERAKAYRL
jgi:hypothetical protein